MKLTVALFSEADPAPVKYALGLIKMMSPCVRLPLVETNSDTKANVASVLASVCEADSTIGNFSVFELPANG